MVGIDLNKDAVRALNAGRSHIADVSSDDLAVMLSNGFRATAEETGLDAPKTIVICVPTPLTASDWPDLTALKSAAETASRLLQPGSLVVLESTTYPGTTDEVVRPLLEKHWGLVAGTDFSLAFSPERIDPGNAIMESVIPPRWLAASRLHAPRLQRFLREAVRPGGIASSAREAEMASLLEILTGT